MLELFTRYEEDATTYMDKFNGSRNMSYIRRVMRNASLIMEEQQSIHPEAKYDYGIVTFGAFMTRAMKNIMMKMKTFASKL